MAQWFRSFAAEPVAAAADVTEALITGVATWNVVAPATHGRGGSDNMLAVQKTDYALTYAGLTFDNAPTAENMEVLIETWPGAWATNPVGVVPMVRASSTACYHGGALPSVDDLIIERIASSTAAAWSQGGSYGFAGNNTTAYRIRLRVEGTTLSIKVWEAAGAEPGTFQHTWVDSNLSGVGAAGILTRTNGDLISHVAFIGVGTDGDSAPDAPVGGPADPTSLAADFMTGSGTSYSSQTSVSPAANSLVIAIIGSNGNDNLSALSSTFATNGWTVAAVNGSAEFRCGIAWAIATGTPGSGTVTATFAGNTFSAHAAILEVASGFDAANPIGAVVSAVFGSDNPVSANFGAVPASSSKLIGAMRIRQVTGGGGVVFTPESGWTNVGAVLGFNEKTQPAYATGSNGQSIGWTLSGAESALSGSSIVGVEVLAAAAVSAPTITDVTPAAFAAGSTPTITGTNFGASQGTGTVKLSPTNDVSDVNAVTQTVSSWGDTSISLSGVSFPTGTAHGGTVYLFVTNDGGDSNTAGEAVTVYLNLPDTEPLYFGATLLSSRTGINWKVTTGHANLNGTVLGSGTNGTTDGSGNFIFPGEVNYGAVNDQVTLFLYWTEGDPVVDRSLIVRTTVVAPV